MIEPMRRGRPVTVCAVGLIVSEAWFAVHRRVLSGPETPLLRVHDPVKVQSVTQAEMPRAMRGTVRRSKRPARTIYTRRTEELDQAPRAVILPRSRSGAPGGWSSRTTPRAM